MPRPRWRLRLVALNQQDPWFGILRPVRVTTESSVPPPALPPSQHSRLSRIPLGPLPNTRLSGEHGVAPRAVSSRDAASLLAGHFSCYLAARCGESGATGGSALSYGEVLTRDENALC